MLQAKHGTKHDQPRSKPASAMKSINPVMQSNTTVSQLSEATVHSSKKIIKFVNPTSLRLGTLIEGKIQIT